MVTQIQLLISNPGAVLAALACTGSFRWTPHPAIVTIMDNKDSIRVLLYSYYTTITGWGVLLRDHVVGRSDVAANKAEICSWLCDRDFRKCTMIDLRERSANLRDSPRILPQTLNPKP